MGLSKKLGTAMGHRSLVPEAISVEYKWSTQAYTVQDILTKFKLPCVVQCATDQCSVAWSKFQFDLRDPLLIYSRQTVRKLHARNLRTSTKEEFGPPVAIPEDYEGWFGAAPKGTNVSKRHTRIETVASSNSLRFLVCTKCPAFTRSFEADGSPSYVPRDITPGETFKKVCVMGEYLSSDLDTPEIVLENGPCLECLDEKDEDVLIPLSRRAIAYEIAEFYPDANHKVFNTKSIISAGNSNLPRILSVLHGQPPVLDYAYTGMLRCYSVFTEETILAATLDEQSPIRLELTTDSLATFKLSLNEASIKRSCEYINALQVCKTSGDAFLSGIKVSFSLKPETLDDINLSMYENQSVSDMQEVDANSEFEIAWSSNQNTNSSKSNVSKSKAPSANSKPHITDNFTLVSGDSKDSPRSESTVRIRTLGNTDNNVDRDLPTPPVDFTEQEIANLMVRKGMIPGLGASSSSDLNLTEEIETLRRTRGMKINPIFISCADTSTEPEETSAQINDISTPINDSKSPQPNKEKDGDAVEDFDRLEKASSDSFEDKETSDIVEISLDETEFVSVVTKKATEYHDIDDGDSDGDSSVIEINKGNESHIENGDGEEVVFVPDVDLENGNTKVKPVKLKEILEINQNSENDYSTIDSVEVGMNGLLDKPVSIDVHSEQGVDSIQNVKDYSNIRPMKDHSEIASEQKMANYNIKAPLVQDSPGNTASANDSVIFPRGLVADKATSSDTMNRNRQGDRKDKEGETIGRLNKYRSETNMSKLFDKFKGNENDSSKSKSSKLKRFQLKGPTKSPAATTDKTLFTMDVDSDDGEC